MDRSGTRIRQRRESSNAQKLRLGDYNVGARDHISNGSFMDNETRSRAETPMGVKTRLKECSNALTTSKELLKIINRMWGQVDRSSSSMSLVSALHSELERARLQVNQLIHEHKPENSNNITYLLMKRFAEEKAAWECNEQEVVEAAIESVAGEIEAERKMKRRLESLNKKLGKELADTKAALMKAVKEVENEKRECFKVKEEVEKERQMLRLADALREERVQMKLSEAKHQTYLKAKRCKEKKITQLHNQESEEYLNHREVEDEDEEDDLHSIELNVVENKSYKWPYGEDNNRGRKSTPSKSISLQRSISDWVVQSEKLQKGGDDGGELDWGRSIEGYLGDTQACKPNKASSKDHHLLSGPRLSNFRGGSVPMSRLLDAAEGENQSARRSRW
ncbi:hypothetical protein Bca52824_018650 [Brassica carinata]|uniref:Uncharacterized protein n=1 Tax=Brassica carinata TaxID=52824 RepID=A0A8X7VP91_BRACI|nr:hypothetical protein Bca52824_018650 [Brassica carinata]